MLPKYMFYSSFCNLYSESMELINWLLNLVQHHMSQISYTVQLFLRRNFYLGSKYTKKSQQRKSV